jgi:hypothetical protein
MKPVVGEFCMKCVTYNESVVLSLHLCCVMTYFICAYRVDNNKQDGMTSSKKRIDMFCKRYVKLLVIKPDYLPNYLNIQRKDITFVNKNKGFSRM